MMTRLGKGGRRMDGEKRRKGNGRQEEGLSFFPRGEEAKRLVVK